MDYVGWCMEGPFIFKDDLGVERSFTDSSPKLLATLLAQSWRRALERKAAAQLGLAPPARLYLGHVVEVLRSLKHQLTPLQAGTLCSFVTQAMWTEEAPTCWLPHHRAVLLRGA